MRAYEIFLNGKLLCAAGIGKHGYISAIVTYLSEKNQTDIDIVGLLASKKLYGRWARRPLRTGDEVRIKIVEKKTVDKFKKIIGRVDKPGRTIQLQKRMVRKLANEFGWEIRQKHTALRA